VSERAQLWLDKFPQLAGTSLTRRLANGDRSEKWLVTRAGERYVLCIDKPVPNCLKLDRAAEFRLLQGLVSEALAPLPVAHAPGALVTGYQDGRTWTPTDLESRKRLRSLAELLSRLHAPRPCAEPLLLADRLRGYARCSGQAHAAQELEQALELLAGAAPEPLVVCHHDPVLGNIVGDAGAMLIDWEYAAAGNRHFDLAAVLEQHCLGGAAEAFFLKHYGKFNPPDHGELRRWRQIYRLTCSLWSMAVASG